MKICVQSISSSNSNNYPYTFIDLCAGIGGGRVGLESQGFKCINYSEFDHKAIHSYKLLHQEDHDGLGDLFAIDTEKLPFVDLIIAGFPCQSYSTMGLRKGLQDQRGQVIYGIATILQDKKIPYFILENVRGLLSVNKGKDFDAILSLLDKTGYNVYYKVLNSMHFGVPHSRKRVYFVGIHKNLDTKEFEFPQECQNGKGLLSILEMTDPISKGTPRYQTFLRYLNNRYNINRYVLSELLEEDFLILDTRHSKMHVYRGYVPTLRKGRQGILYCYQSKLYALSKNDALRLQGVPDLLITRIQDVSKSVILEQAGNAMTINVIAAIAKQLRLVMTKST